MIEEIKYLLVGLIQGLAEFFPISSSGHIILTSSFLGIIEKHPLLFSITVHFATTLSTIIVYRNSLKNIVLGILRDKNPTHINFVLKIILSSLPIIIVGLLFRSQIDLIFHNATYLVCVMLIFTGCILFSTSIFKIKQGKINFFHAFIMGLAQALAIIPGISRSGVTIATAIFLKINRKEAAEFSFLMVLIPIIGITIIELYLITSSSEQLSFMDIKGLFIAFFSAFFSGLFACRYMIKIIQTNSLKYFGYYCVLVGLISFLLL